MQSRNWPWVPLLLTGLLYVVSAFANEEPRVGSVPPSYDQPSAEAPAGRKTKAAVPFKNDAMSLKINGLIQQAKAASHDAKTNSHKAKFHEGHINNLLRHHGNNLPRNGGDQMYLLHKFQTAYDHRKQAETLHSESAEHYREAISIYSELRDNSNVRKLTPRLEDELKKSSTNKEEAVRLQNGMDRLNSGREAGNVAPPAYQRSITPPPPYSNE